MGESSNGEERKAVMIYISQQAHQRLKAVAASQRRSMNAQAALAVEEHLAEQERLARAKS